MKSIILSLLVLLFSQTTFSSQTVKLDFDLKIKNQFASDARFVFIVDNSGSMGQHQEKMANALLPAIDKLKNAGVEFDAHLLTTESYDNQFLKSFDSTNNKVALDLVDAVRTLGTAGNANEKAFYSFLQVADHLNPSNSYLNIVLVTDEPEQSLETIEDFYQKALTLNGGLIDRINFYAVTYDDAKGCQSQSGSGSDDVLKFANTVQHFGNRSKLINICDDQEIIQEMDLIIDDTITNVTPADPKPVYLPVRSIQLGLTPVFSSIEVRYGSQVLVKGILPVGYIYSSTDNKLYFGDKVSLSVQPKGTKLTVEYLSNDDITSEDDTLNTVLELH